MGRPKEHDERVAATLLAAAERIVHERGLAALSVRGAANDAGTTTRAVYSLFGSKEGLVAALGAHAFDLLGDAVAALPTTSDPRSDLVAAGLIFRRFALEHPALFSIGVQRTLASELWPRFRSAASSALAVLGQRVARLEQAGLLGERSVYDATCQFHALCEGLAAVELRGTHAPAAAERIWTEGLTALVTGFAVPSARPASR